MPLTSQTTLQPPVSGLVPEVKLKEKLIGSLKPSENWVYGQKTYCWLHNDALITTWIYRSCINTQCKTLAEYFLKMKLPLTKLWQCNLSPSDIERIFCNAGFWKSVMIAWSRVNFHQPWIKENIASQSIWYNSLLHINNVVIEPKESFPIDCTISDICDDQGNLVHFNTFVKQHQISSVHWLFYRTIQYSIPKLWLSILKDEI